MLLIKLQSPLSKVPHKTWWLMRYFVVLSTVLLELAAKLERLDKMKNASQAMGN